MEKGKRICQALKELRKRIAVRIRITLPHGFN